MSDNRPVNLELTTVRLPITAIASILHRVSAVITWVGLGILLLVLGCAMSSPEHFADTKTMLTEGFFGRFVLWGLLSAAAYYCLATIKHFIQDLGYFEDFKGGQMLSWAVLGLGVICVIWAGVAVWA